MTHSSKDSSDWDYRVFSCETNAVEFGVFQPIVSLRNSKRVQDKLPAWRAFGMQEFAGWFGWVSVCDITYDPIFDTRYRLWGTHVVETLGYEMTGRSPRLNTKEPFKYEGGYSQTEFDFLETLARQPAIGVTAGSIHWQDRDFVRYEEIVLPLADDGEVVDKLLFVIRPTDLSQ